MHRAWCVQLRGGIMIALLWVLLAVTVGIFIGVLEIGYRVGAAAHRRSSTEKPEAVTRFAAALLGLAAFMLGFTFSLSADRYLTRRQKAREEVDAIQIAFLRSDFLPEPDRRRSRTLIAQYVSEIARAPETDLKSEQAQRAAYALDNAWHRQLWSIATSYGRAYPESNLADLYISGVNQMFAIRSERVMLATAEQVRIPIWLVLYGLSILAVASVAYHTGITGSRRSKVGLLLAVAFALVLALIADLDRVCGYIVVSQAPFQRLEDGIAGLMQADP